MPNYDTKCSECGYSSIETVKLAELASWDLSAKCPQCASGNAKYRRIIKSAPNGRNTTDSIGSQLASQKESFIKSGRRDDMRHEASKRTNKDQIAAARESVKRGEFEGF